MSIHQLMSFYGCTTSWLQHEEHGILVPWPGLNLGLLYCEHRVFITGPPGKSYQLMTFSMNCLFHSFDYWVYHVLLIDQKKCFYMLRWLACLPVFSAGAFFSLHFHTWRAYLVALMAKNLPAMQETRFDPGLGRSPGEGHGNPLQCSCLENPMDRGAWRATVHGVAKTRTQLSNWHTFILGDIFMWQKPFLG